MDPQVEQWVAWGNIHLIDVTSFSNPLKSILKSVPIPVKHEIRELLKTIFRSHPFPTLQLANFSKARTNAEWSNSLSPWAATALNNS
jgi:hypothetical protein